jgi:hypothetical protein
MEAFLPSRDSVRYFIREFVLGLPRPVPDTEDNVRQRNRHAVESIAALMPASWAEAMLASHYVLLRAEAFDCHRFASNPRNNPADTVKASALAQRFGRTAQAAWNQLLRTQSLREKRETAETAAQSGAAILAIRALLFEALAVELIPPPPEPEPPPPPEPEPEPEPGPITDELIHAANMYAELYPHRITFIRKHGGVPNFAAFELKDKELIHAILHADTPRLNALNPKPKEYPPDDPRSRHDFV